MKKTTSLLWILLLLHISPLAAAISAEEQQRLDGEIQKLIDEKYIFTEEEKKKGAHEKAYALYIERAIPLLEQGANINIRGKNKEPVKRWSLVQKIAYYSDNPDNIKPLLHYGGNIRTMCYPLPNIFKEKKMRFITFIKRHKAQASQMKKYLSEYDENGRKLMKLHYKNTEKDVETASKLLVQTPEIINYQPARGGWTPLIQAVYDANEKATKALLAAPGINIYLRPYQYHPDGSKLGKWSTIFGQIRDATQKEEENKEERNELLALVIDKAVKDYMKADEEQIGLKYLGDTSTVNELKKNQCCFPTLTIYW